MNIDIISKFYCTSRKLFNHGISQPTFYGKVVSKYHKFKTIHYDLFLSHPVELVEKVGGSSNRFKNKISC